MLSRLYQWAIGGWSPTPGPPSVSIQCVRIPADGSPPHLILLSTTDIRDDGTPDSFLSHVPDLRTFWGREEGWHFRDVALYTAENQPLGVLNGLYWGFKSFALDVMPISAHTGFCGDAFIAKSPAEELDEDGWHVYEDVPAEFLGSRVMGEVLERLHAV